MSKREESSNSSMTPDHHNRETEQPITVTRKIPLAVLPVTAFGKYTLVGKLGHNGMIEVFLAYSSGPAGFRKLVAVKRLNPILEESPDFLELFLDEARLAARLNHPNIVQCFEIGHLEKIHYIAMEYLDGQNLESIHRQCALKRKKLPFTFIVRIINDALVGLNYAHNLQDFDGAPLKIVHRDISPPNIFVTYDGVIKLMDFGIAKATTQLVDTKSGVIKGRFAYMAPEQARHSTIDHRADLWSMGVVLWECLANRRLFGGPNDLATLNSTLMDEIPNLKNLDPELPDELAAVAEKALSRDVEKRYQNALEMKEDLETSLDSSGTKPAGRNDISEFTKTLFSEVIEYRREILKACLSDREDSNKISTGRYQLIENITTEKRISSVSELTPLKEKSSRSANQNSVVLKHIGIFILVVLLSVLLTFAIFSFLSP